MKSNCLIWAEYAWCSSVPSICILMKFLFKVYKLIKGKFYDACSYTYYDHYDWFHYLIFCCILWLVPLNINSLKKNFYNIFLELFSLMKKSRAYAVKNKRVLASQKWKMDNGRLSIRNVVDQKHLFIQKYSKNLDKLMYLLVIFCAC